MYRRSLVFAAACLGMLLFGVTLTTLGSVLPPLMSRVGLDRAQAGSLMSLMSLGILVASLFFGPIVDRHGYRGVLLAGTLGILAGLEGIALAHSAWLLAPAVFLFGVSGGVLNGSTNALAADISEEDRGSGLAILGIFFGIGAFGVPLLLAVLLARFDYATVLMCFGLLVILPAAFLLMIRFPPPKQPQGLPIRQAGGLLREKPLLLLGGMLFFQSGMEITLGGWSAQFVHEALGLDEGRSILVLSFFWIGMVLARLLLAPLLRRGLPPPAVLGPHMALAVVGSLVLLSSRSEGQAIAGLFLTGFGLAAGYPVVLGAIGGLYSRLTGTAFSIAFVMALVGGSLVPYLTGLLGDRFGLRLSLSSVVVCQVLMAVLFVIAARPGQTQGGIFTRRKDLIDARN